MRTDFLHGQEKVFGEKNNAPAVVADVEKNIQNHLPELFSAQDEMEFFKETDFRGVFWDMSRAEVQEKELLTLVQQSKDRLVYEGDYFGYQVRIYYLFENNLLTGAQIVFPSSTFYLSSRIKMFWQIKENLKKDWGEPVVYDANSFKNMPNNSENSDEQEKQISLGKQSLLAEWSLARSFVRLKLSGGSESSPRLYLLLAYYKNLPPPQPSQSAGSKKMEELLLQKKEKNLSPPNVEKLP